MLFHHYFDRTIPACRNYINSTSCVDLFSLDMKVIFFITVTFASPAFSLISKQFLKNIEFQLDNWNFFGKCSGLLKVSEVTTGNKF